MPVFNFTFALFMVYLTLCGVACGQDNASAYSVPNIHEIEPVQNHYFDLQGFSAEPEASRQWMDTISYPPELYRNNTMLYALAQPVYLSPSQVEYLKTSVNFPANSSEQTRKELDFLLELQQERTSAQTARVMELAQIGYWPDANLLASHPRYDDNLQHLFFEVREVMGDDYQPLAYPYTTQLLQGVMNDMRLMEFAVKYQLLRARPYQLEPQLEPLRKISSPSFASGHTLWAYLQAYTLSELIPHRRKEFVELAYEIAFSREIMGVHYPSDEEAARQLAHRMLELMWHTAKFQGDFKNAQTEWR